MLNENCNSNVGWKNYFKKKEKNKTELLAVSQSGNVSQFLTELIKTTKIMWGKKQAALWEINQSQP